MRFAPLLSACLLSSVAHAASTLELDVAGAPLQVEVAADSASRQQGLMGRQALGENAGMLFRFPERKTHCLWMKNTPLPLSAAFLDDGGRIVDLIDLQPHSLDIRCSQAPARYALEVNQGWFVQRGIAVGDRVRGLPATQP